MSTEHPAFSFYRSDGKLYGFVCVVINALSPLGASICTELASHDAANIYACVPKTSSPGSSSTLLSALEASHSNTRVVPYTLSTAREDDTLGMIDDILRAGGRLGVWVCAESVLGSKSIEESGPKGLRACMEGNALGPILALKYARRAMQKRCSKRDYPNATEKDGSYGSIVVVGSVAANGGGKSEFLREQYSWCPESSALLKIKIES